MGKSPVFIRSYSFCAMKGEMGVGHFGRIYGHVGGQNGRKARKDSGYSPGILQHGMIRDARRMYCLRRLFSMCKKF